MTNRQGRANQVGMLALLAGLLFASTANAEDPLTLPEPPPLSDFQAMIDRPLFYSDRRPKALEETAPNIVDEPAVKETWRLSGVILNPTGHIALFEERQGDRRLKLTQGMPLNTQWMLESVHPDHVLLTYNEQTLRMELREPREESLPGVPKRIVLKPGTTAAPEAPQENEPANNQQTSEEATD